ncbi:MAG: class I SAM-dependent methyltransferase [candidate division KSB1 bacterium]|nr:class I SAM-dependent methyltransferase [candidate division KSB1 bacterium]
MVNWQVYSNWSEWQFQSERREFVSFVIQELDLDQTARVLEIGSGAGWVSLELARRMSDVEVIGVESNPDLVELAKKNKSDQKITNASFVHLDFGSLKTLAHRTFDCIVSFRGLKNWESPIEVFNQLNLLLKPAGSYAIADYRGDLKWLARLSIWYSERTMPKPYRAFWREAFANCYSVQQMIKILISSHLVDWKIRTTLFDFLIYKPKFNSVR